MGETFQILVEAFDFMLDNKVELKVTDTKVIAFHAYGYVSVMRIDHDTLRDAAVKAVQLMMVKINELEGEE